MEYHRPEDGIKESKSSSIQHNKRKRKITASEDYLEDSENLQPPKRQYSPSPSNLSSYSSTSTVISISSSSSGTRYHERVAEEGNVSSNPSSPAEFDLSQLTSPPASVLACDEHLDTFVNHKTPHGTTETSGRKNKSTCIVTPSSELRLCPLPPMSWAHSEDVWKLMCRKDACGSLNRDSQMLNYHIGIHIRMRAILLDWLIEVCEVYKLHRETYYLAVDFLDRFLTSKMMKINKTHLQLIGITCLFIGAKVEEIYPPKIGEFAYVTDGACSEEDIIKQEIILLKALDWDISPVTIMGWLSVYMQVITTANHKNLSEPSFEGGRKEGSGSSKATTTSSPIKFFNRNYDAFVYPQFSGMEFAQTAQLVDLCSLDVGLSNFSYSVVAAAALSHTYDRKSAIFASGLEWQDIEACAKWMEPFYRVICEEINTLYLLESNEQVKQSHGLQHICPNLVADESHTLQTHTISLAMFDKVIALREQLLEMDTMCRSTLYPEVSPAVVVTNCPEGLLTPPASNRKPVDNTCSLEVETANQTVNAT